MNVLFMVLYNFMSISIKCAQHIQMFAAFSLEVMAVKILHPG